MAHKTLSPAKSPERSGATSNGKQKSRQARLKNVSYSTLLFAHPSFVGGIARLFDFGNTLTEYNLALSPEQSDMLALLADQRAIFHDFQVANSVAKPERDHAKE